MTINKLKIVFDLERFLTSWATCPSEAAQLPLPGLHESHAEALWTISGFQELLCLVGSIGRLESHPV